MNALHKSIFAEMTKANDKLTRDELAALNNKVVAITGINLNDLFAAYDNSNVTYMSIGDDFDRFAAYLAEADANDDLAGALDEFVELANRQ